jgi:hypothetical protein
MKRSTKIFGPVRQSRSIADAINGGFTVQLRKSLILISALIGGFLIVRPASAGVTFSSPNTLNTTAVFDSTGTYVLQARASDGVRFSTKTVTIVVNTTVVPPSLAIAPASAIAGNAVDVTVNFTNGVNAQNVSGLQFDLTLPSGVSSNTVIVGAAAQAAGKSVSANMVGSALRVIIFGLNSDPMGSGAMAVINLRLAANLTINRSLALSGIVGTDPAGVNVPMTFSNGSIVVTANAAPTLSISASATSITLPAQNSVDLTGTATDDGAPNPPGALSYSWSVL